MKEKIEKKISEHINSILRKEHLDFVDYQILTAEISRIKADEAAKKYEEETAERNERMSQLMSFAMGK